METQAEYDITEWKNEDNKTFYDNLPRDWLSNTINLIGLDKCSDVELIRKHIANAKSILELGAGYGRVLSYLRKSGYKDKITAIERCIWACQKLREDFSDTVEIIEADIAQYNFEEKYDLILWLWSGFCDFAKVEQPVVLKKIKEQLNENGVIVIEMLFPLNRPANAIKSEEQHHWFSADNKSNLHVYIPSFDEVVAYANQLNIPYFEYITYTTVKGSKRILYVLGNKILQSK